MLSDVATSQSTFPLVRFTGDASPDDPRRMEIASLRLIVTQDDLNALCARWIVTPPLLRDLRLYVTPPGLSVTGVYQKILPIRFETLWTFAVDAGKIAARLSDIRVVGMRANFLRSYLMNALASQIPIAQLQEETFLLDLDRLLESRGIPLKIHLAAVRCERGKLVIECGQDERV